MRLSGVAVAVAVCLACATIAAAQEDAQPVQDDYQDYLGLGTKQFKVRGKMSTEIWFDNNILLTADSEKDDVITVLVPELNLRFDHGDDYVKLDYRGRDRLYSDNSVFNGMEHYLDGVVHFRISKFFVEVTDNYANRRDPFNTFQIAFPLDSLQNDARLLVGGDFDKFDLELSAGIRRFEIFNNVFDLLDHRRFDVSFTGLFDIMPKTQALVEYGYTNTEFDQDTTLDNFETHRLLVGIKGSPTAKIRTTAKAGFVQILADNSNGVDDTDDKTDLYVAVALDWDVTASGLLKVEIYRQPIESIFGSIAITDRLAVSYNHNFTERVSANLGLYYEDFSEIKGGEDRTGYGLNGGLAYKVGRHLNLGAHVEYRAKRSDNDNFEFDDLRGMFSAGLDF
jgi:opacity protein-like surface antigen